MTTREELHALISADLGLRSISELVQSWLDEDPGHDWEHCLRVAQWTVRLTRESGEVADRNAIAAALLHDVVALPKNSPGRSKASELSAEVARELLERADFAFDSASIDAICTAIRQHSWSRGDQPLAALAQALQDADRLDALGAIGAFRTVSTGARMGSLYYDEADPWAEHRELDDSSFTLDHFFRKLLALPALMHHASARAEAERRVRTMKLLLHAIGEELGRPVPESRLPKQNA